MSMGGQPRRSAGDMAIRPKLIVINGATGEQREYAAENDTDLERSFDSIDEHFSWLDRARKNLNRKRHEEHIRLMQAKTVEYLESEGFQASYGAVYLLMLGKARYGGRIPLTRQKIEEVLGYSRQTVTRAIKHLVANGVIEVGEHEDRPAYFFASAAAAKGFAALKNSNEMAKDVRSRAAARGMRLVEGGKT